MVYCFGCDSFDCFWICSSHGQKVWWGNGSISRAKLRIFMLIIQLGEVCVSSRFILFSFLFFLSLFLIPNHKLNNNQKRKMHEFVEDDEMKEVNHSVLYPSFPWTLCVCLCVLFFQQGMKNGGPVSQRWSHAQLRKAK